MRLSKMASESSEVAHIVLSVYFSGTDHYLDELNRNMFSTAGWMAGTLFNDTCETMCHKKMGFDGCAIEKGSLSGGIFGFGLDEQCAQVMKRVRTFTEQGISVIVNAYGHSRGGIACLLLAKKLARMEQVAVNLVLVDPVPGNFRNTAFLDFGKVATLKGQAQDLSMCSNLRKVLAIYPADPLPAILAHAPVLPIYPADCELMVELVPGCHSETQMMFRDKILLPTCRPATPSSRIVFMLAANFLEKCGTQFSQVLKKGVPCPTNDPCLRSETALLDAYNEYLQYLDKKSTLDVAPFLCVPTSRTTHLRGLSHTSIERKILRNAYLTPRHKALAETLGSPIEGADGLPFGLSWSQDPYPSSAAPSSSKCV